jgi:hypothetical protein
MVKKRESTSKPTKTAQLKENNTMDPLNPFFTTLNGISVLFASAISVGIVLLLINAVSSMLSFSRDDTNFDEINKSVERVINSPQDFIVPGLLALVIIVFAIVVSAMIHGISSYTAAQLSRGNKVTIGTAFYTVLENFGNYLILYVWMNVKIFLWTLLFIIPGIFAYYRYTFAGIVFFDKDLRHEHAIKESIRLTKGGRMTIFASQFLFNTITFQYITTVVDLAANSQLYRIYKDLDNNKTAKPDVHWLSWLTLAIPFLLILIGMVLAVIAIVSFAVAGGRFSE